LQGNLIGSELVVVFPYLPRPLLTLSQFTPGDLGRASLFLSVVCRLSVLP
jgi:hypothetical protein